MRLVAGRDITQPSTPTFMCFNDSGVLSCRWCNLTKAGQSFKGHRHGSVLTKNTDLELMQSPTDLHHRQGLFFVFFFLNKRHSYIVRDVVV